MEPCVSVSVEVKHSQQVKIPGILKTVAVGKGKMGSGVYTHLIGASAYRTVVAYLQRIQIGGERIIQAVDVFSSSQTLVDHFTASHHIVAEKRRIEPSSMFPCGGSAPFKSYCLRISGYSLEVCHICR